jgi:hypothetical protein
MAIPQGYDIRSVAHKLGYVQDQVDAIAPAKFRDYYNILGSRPSASTYSISWSNLYIEGTDLGSFSGTVDITASGALGLDTGSEASSTWYYVHAIASSDFQTVSAIFSSSPTSPTLPIKSTGSSPGRTSDFPSGNGYILCISFNGYSSMGYL